jgi:hypothetical protein
MTLSCLLQALPRVPRFRCVTTVTQLVIPFLQLCGACGPLVPEKPSFVPFLLALALRKVGSTPFSNGYVEAECSY